MPRIKKLILSALLAVSVIAISAFAFQSDPKTAYEEIMKAQAAEMQANPPRTLEAYNAILAKSKEKALAAIKDVDASKIEAKDAYDWARIYSVAEKHKETCDLIHKFLMTSPAGDARFNAQILVMKSCNALEEGEMLVEMLRDTKPATWAQSSTYSGSAMSYANTIGKTEGADAAVKALDDVKTKLIFENPADYAQRVLKMQKAAEEKNPPRTTPKPDEERLKALEAQAGTMRLSTLLAIAETQAEILAEANRKEDAAKVFDAFIKELPEGSPILRSANIKKTMVTLPGSASPTLDFERGYGDFKGLESLKGKVVVLDFFAHWCGPCIAAFPEMRKMYDELKPQGLEIIGVTRYYGYYKQENAAARDMPKDTEFGKMADFMKDHSMNWPVIYGNNVNFENYGVSGIPHVVIIDRTGRVQKIKVGYSPELFKQFRTELEKLLKQ